MSKASNSRKMSLRSSQQTGVKRKYKRNGEQNKKYKRIRRDSEWDESKSNDDLLMYTKLKGVYEEEVSQKTHQFLTRITKSKIENNPNLTKYPIMQYMSNAIKTVMMNEYEIWAWAVWLDQYDLDDNSTYSVEELINFTALVIKLRLNDEEFYKRMYTTYFNNYIKGFISKLNVWVKDSMEEYVFDPVKVNK